MKCILTKCTFILSLLLLSQAAIAQIRVSGKVTDETGDPLIGVSILEKETVNGTVSDIEGNFAFDLKNSKGGTLVFSFVGYGTTEIAVTSSGVINATMKESSARLEEVVVTGLSSSIKRSNAATAVSRLGADDLTGSTRPATLDGAMSGKLIGANIQANSGAPGGGMSIKLRGISSVVGSSEPLYVIDGIIVDNSQFNTGAGTRSFNGAVSTANAGSQDQAANRISDINPADIESIDVLKGPAAAAIYGTRANAGVIVIQTKRGKSGKTAVKFSQDFGSVTASNLLKSEDWTEAKINAFGGYYGVGVADALTAFRAAKGATVDYDKEVFGETGNISNSTLSVSGGSEKTKFYVSAGAQNEGGIVKNTYFKRYSGRVNVDHRINDWVDVKVSSGYYNTASSRSFLGNDNNGVSLGYSIAYIPNFLDLRPKEVNGKLVYPESPGTGQNPLEIRDRMKNLEFSNRFLNSGEINFQLFRTESSNLKFSFKGGVDYVHAQPQVYAPEDLQYQSIRPNAGASRYANNKALLTYIQTFLTLGWKVKALDLTSQVGFLRNDKKTDESYIQGEGLLAGQRNPATANVRFTDQFLSKTADLAIDFNQEFNWEDKVVGRVGVRTDKSSLNGDETKFYTFPRAQVALNLANFDFLKGSSIVSQLKPRVAYGQTGGVPSYGDLFTSLVGVNYGGQLGIISPSVNGNSTLEPETADELEIGLDLGFFKNRVTLEATWFNKNVYDFLFAQPLSVSTGVTSIARVAAGDLSNKGVELGINAQIVKKANFEWNSGFQFWNVKTKIERLAIVESFVPTSGFGDFGRRRLVVGKSPSLWWGRNAAGQSPVEFGKDAQPTYQLSWNNNLRLFKRFDFNMLWHTSQGNYLSSLTRELKDEGGTSSDWTAVVKDQNSPRLFGNPGTTTENYLIDASYIRLREISLYYNIPSIAKLTKNAISNVRIGVSGQNLVTISDALDVTYDPEASNFGNSALGFGVDLTPFPAAKRMFLHVMVDF
jgi:TonB-linked SusC/RagA family outer membrane protein